MAKKKNIPNETLLVIPPEVKNKEAYIEYDELQREMQKFAFIETSDPNLVVNGNWLPQFTNNKCIHLPDEERLNIMAIIKGQRQRISRCGVLKRRAYGITGGYSDRDNVILVRVLGEERCAELLELFGAYYSLGDVHRIINEDWGIDAVSIPMLSKWRMVNIEKIAERQQAFTRDFGNIRLTHKRSRLEELTSLYSHRKEIYQTSKSQSDYKLLLETLRYIKQEVEGDRVVIDGKIEVDIKSTLNAHTQQEIMGRINLITLVVARISAKATVNPIWMMSKLMNSYYSQFSGMSLPSNDPLLDEISYPNSQSYNFENIRQMHENMKMSQSHLQTLTRDIPIDQEVVVKDARSQLQNLLQQRQNRLVSNSLHVQGLRESTPPSLKGTPKKKK